MFYLWQMWPAAHDNQEPFCRSILAPGECSALQPSIECVVSGDFFPDGGQLFGKGVFWIAQLQRRQKVWTPLLQTFLSNLGRSYLLHVSSAAEIQNLYKLTNHCPAFLSNITLHASICRDK